MPRISLFITKNTMDYINADKDLKGFIKINKMTFQNSKDGYKLIFEPEAETIRFVYDLILFIHQRLPEENNKLIILDKRYNMNDSAAIKYFLYDLEGTDHYPLRQFILSDIIKKEKIHNLQQLKELSNKPFSGILPYDKVDVIRQLPSLLNVDIPQCINIDHNTIYVSNRYIQNSFEIAHSKVTFRNCVINGDITIQNSSEVCFDQCIITGKVTCYGISNITLSGVNMKHLFLYNSNLQHLYFEYSKIYRFVFHSCAIENIRLFKNHITEPYIANLMLPDIQLDMSQFVKKNINKRTIDKIDSQSPVKIKNYNKYYLTFMLNAPDKTISTEDVALDMIDTILTYGALNKDHHLYSNMKYKKRLYSNTMWRKFFVFLTGGFYIPSRWILYLVFNVIIFSILYSVIPQMQFTNIATNSLENIGFWVALNYSVYQIIGANPTNYVSFGITQIFSSFQSLLNTVFIANLFTTIMRKYLRDES